jgi:hypothetical protein
MSARVDPTEYASGATYDEQPPLYKERTNDSLLAAAYTASTSSSPPQSPLSPTTPSSITFGSPLDLPPTYSSHETQAQSFVIQDELIYSTSTSHTPRYQLSKRTTKSGAAYQLRIRRLLNAESRRLSLRSGDKGAQVEFDNEGTMYIISANSAVGGKGLDIKGCRASTLRGKVVVERRNGVIRFTHMTRNAARDSLNPENEKRMQKYGYRPQDEWDSDPLYSVKRTAEQDEWKDRFGKLVATEQNGEFKIMGNSVGEVDRAIRDLLVTCWTAARWRDGQV